MGTERKKSSARTLARVVEPRAERPTLVFCPACEGKRQQVVDLPDGRYRVRMCKWCDGTGCVDKRMFVVFKRWLQIYNHNRVRGLCPKPRTG